VTEPRPAYATDADAKVAEMSGLERTWETYWRMFGPLDAQDYEREYPFCAPERGWRFDAAWPERVAVELHGGTWSQGRHVRGGGFRDDREKMNAATLLGWLVFEFTTDMLQDDPRGCVDMVAKAIGRRRDERKAA
jgi:hypothetical protein